MERLFKRIMCGAILTLLLPLYPASAAPLSALQVLDDKNETIPLSQLKGESEVLVLVFVASTCPVTTLYWERLKGIWYNHREHDVRMILIGGNADDQPKFIHTKLNELDLDLPLYWDSRHGLAKSLQLHHTPLVAVIDRNWEVCYRGRIDDFWRDETRVTRRYLDDAITAARENRKSPDQMDALFLGSAIR